MRLKSFSRRTLGVGMFAAASPAVPGLSWSSTSLGQDAGAQADTPAESGSGLAVRVHSIRVISRNDGYYCGWPTLTRRSNGQLILVWSGGREQHVCPFGRVDAMKSDDEGKTWSWPRTLLDGAIDDRDAGVLETASGSLLVTTFTSLAYVDYELKKAIRQQGTEQGWSEDRLRNWLAVHERMSEEQRRSELGQWMIRSTDGGITWSERYPSIVNSPHGPIQLSDGRQLYAGVKLWDPSRLVGVCQSVDDGQSWKWLAEIPTRPGDDPKNYHELHAVEATDGTIVVQIRNHNTTNHRETLQCESKDGGKTWTMPHSINVWGLPSHLLRLSDGRLLMSYGYRRKPFGIQARLSQDSGESWSKPLSIASDGVGGDLGYPSTVELPGGKLLTVWYERMKTSPKAVLRQAEWSVES